MPPPTEEADIAALKSDTGFIRDSLREMKDDLKEMKRDFQAHLNWSQKEAGRLKALETRMTTFERNAKTGAIAMDKKTVALLGGAFLLLHTRLDLALRFILKV